MIRRDDAPAAAVEVGEDETRGQDLLLRALAADEDDVGAVCGEAAAHVAADRTRPHDPDTKRARAGHDPTLLEQRDARRAPFGASHRTLGFDP